MIEYGRNAWVCEVFSLRFQTELLVGLSRKDPVADSSSLHRVVEFPASALPRGRAPNFNVCRAVVHYDFDSYSISRSKRITRSSLLTPLMSVLITLHPCLPILFSHCSECCESVVSVRTLPAAAGYWRRAESIAYRQDTLIFSTHISSSVPNRVMCRWRSGISLMPF